MVSRDWSSANICSFILSRSNYDNSYHDISIYLAAIIIIFLHYVATQTLAETRLRPSIINRLEHMPWPKLLLKQNLLIPS